MEKKQKKPAEKQDIHFKQSRLPKTAKLVLEDGSEYPGLAFGKPRSQAGEVIFHTGMTGYPGLLSDPCNRGRIIVFTYPLTGNCGVPVNKNGEPFFDELGIPVSLESNQIHAAGLVISELCEKPSHYSSGITLSEWFEKGNVPGICGIDTRSLAIRLRERGSMRGKILVENSRDVTFDSGVMQNPVSDISPGEIKSIIPSGSKTEKRIKIAMIDCGAKANIIRCLLARNVEIIRLPWNHDLNGIEYSGLLLSNGPGDPKDCGRTIASVRKAFVLGKPIFGIGLGCQILALAAGADTYKAQRGHHGLNLPCMQTGTSRCFITSQNHSFAIRSETIPRGWEPWFINANDGSVEGIRSLKNPFFAVQFHPEGCPGPRDTEFLFDNFLEQARIK